MSDTTKLQQAADSGLLSHALFGSSEITRKAFICVGCDFVYCDDPPTSCDCMKDPSEFIEGVIHYSLPNDPAQAAPHPNQQSNDDS